MRITFENVLGRKVFRTTTDAYHSIHGVYPKVLTELPEFLTSVGYPCTGVMGMGYKDIGLYQQPGLEMEDEDATAFILKWG